LNDARIYDGVFPTIRPKLDTEGERNVWFFLYSPSRRDFPFLKREKGSFCERSHGHLQALVTKSGEKL
jgi:hypothetical protein